MVEANGTLEPMLDSGKSEGAVIVTASRWLGPVILLIVLLFLGSLLLSRLLLCHLQKPHYTQIVSFSKEMAQRF
jgi:hypothetical protein